MEQPVVSLDGVAGFNLNTPDFLVQCYFGDTN